MDEEGKAKWGGDGEDRWGGERGRVGGRGSQGEEEEVVEREGIAPSPPGQTASRIKEIVFLSLKMSARG